MDIVWPCTWCRVFCFEVLVTNNLIVRLSTSSLTLSEVMVTHGILYPSSAMYGASHDYNQYTYAMALSFYVEYPCSPPVISHNVLIGH